MNDAGSDLRGANESGRVAWAQVSVEGFNNFTTPLQLLLACMEDVVARFGTLRLEALNLVIPVTSRQESRAAILDSLNWFERPAPPADFTVVVGTGRGSSATALACKILEQVSGAIAGVFEFDEIHSVDDVRATSAREFIDPSVWNVVLEAGGSGRIRAPEWSLDSLALVARSAVQAAHGLGLPCVTVSFSRDLAPVDAG